MIVFVVVVCFLVCLFVCELKELISVDNPCSPDFKVFKVNRIAFVVTHSVVCGNSISCLHTAAVAAVFLCWKFVVIFGLVGFCGNKTLVFAHQAPHDANSPLSPAGASSERLVTEVRTPEGIFSYPKEIYRTTPKELGVPEEVSELSGLRFL